MRDRLIHWINLAVAILAMPVIGIAQQPVRRAESVSLGGALDLSPANAVATVTQRAVLVDPNKRLGVGDQVAIEIVEDREGPIARLASQSDGLGDLRAGFREASFETVEPRHCHQPNRSTVCSA